MIGLVLAKWKGHKGDKLRIRQADMVQVGENAIKGNITSKSREKVQSTRIGIACVCTHSPLGIGGRREQARK
jgi:hypothetical protein